MKIDKRIWMVGGVAVAAGLFVLGTYYPGVASELRMLAGTVLGWVAFRRPGDAKVTK